MSTEEKFIVKLKEKDIASFCLLYDNYSGALYSIVLKLVFDGKSASEILQKCFVRIWLKIGSYDGSKERLFTWMAIIARNLATELIQSGNLQDPQLQDP